MTNLIAPTVSRHVWFWPNHRHIEAEGFICIDPAQPMDAVIAYVWDRRLVNLSVIDHAGNHHSFTSIALWHGDNDRPNGAYCEWMPYQVGQAKKAEEDLTAKVSALFKELWDKAWNIDGATTPAATESHASAAPGNEAYPAIPAIQIAPAFDTLKKAMRDDPEYAWAWQCNLAMPIMDAIVTVTHRQANRAAASLMQHLFGIDMTEHPNLKALEASWAANDAAVEKVKAGDAEPPKGRAAWADAMKKADEADERAKGRAAAAAAADRNGEVYTLTLESARRIADMPLTLHVRAGAAIEAVDFGHLAGVGEAPCTQAVGNGPNPFYEGQHDGETPEQAQIRRTYASTGEATTAERLERAFA